MIAPKDHDRESDRIKDLKSYSILDTLPEADFDNITAIAAEICNTEISLISLVDTDRQWFKSHHGLTVSETQRESSFCAHAINKPEEILIVPDTRTDERFHDNPLVTGEPYIQFYAGVPLISKDGLPLGTLCVIDTKPKLLSNSQKKSLNALAKQVMNNLNLRKTKLILEKSLDDLKEKNQELERFAFIAAHDLKSPLIGILSMSRLLKEQYGPKIDKKGNKMITIIGDSSNKLRSMVDGLLEYSKSDTVLKETKSRINLMEMRKDFKDLLSYEPNFKLNIKSSINELVTNKAALYQILINLIDNAIKYNDKKDTIIEIGVSDLDTHYEFYVHDNGPGIPLKYHEKIFEIFEVLTSKNRFNESGNGIGLATVKKIVEKSGGIIKVESDAENWTKFIFTIEK